MKIKYLRQKDFSRATIVTIVFNNFQTCSKYIPSPKIAIILKLQIKKGDLINSRIFL